MLYRCQPLTVTCVLGVGYVPKVACRAQLATSSQEPPITMNIVDCSQDCAYSAVAGQSVWTRRDGSLVHAMLETASLKSVVETPYQASTLKLAVQCDRSWLGTMFFWKIHVGTASHNLPCWRFRIHCEVCAAQSPRLSFA